MSHLFRPKKPIDDFSMLSVIFLDQKPITLLEAPKVGPIYKDTLDDYMCGGIRRSYTQISIDSGIYEKKEDEDWNINLTVLYSVGSYFFKKRLVWVFVSFQESIMKSIVTAYQMFFLYYFYALSTKCTCTAYS